MTKQTGFTLLEILIVVAIIGILAAVAMPSYQESIAKGKRADATATLVGAASALERYMTENDTYATATLANTGVPSEIPKDESAKSYTIAYSNLTATTYTITATAKNSMSGDRCGNYTYTHTGAKSVSTSATDCW